MSAEHAPNGRFATRVGEPSTVAPATTVDLTLPSRWWLLATVALRAGLAVFFSIQHHRLFGNTYTFFVTGGDTYSYLEPIENLLARGWYVLDPSQPLSQAGRMPGYGFTYLVFRFFTSPELAKTLLVCFQVLLSGASVYFLARTTYLLLKRRVAFYIVLLLYGPALFVTTWDYVLLTESLATSSVIFYFYQLVAYQRAGGRHRLAIAALWFAYAVFLRPFLLPLILAALPFVWPRMKDWRSVAPAVLVNMTIVGSAFLVADSIWIVRNHRLFNRIVPLQINSIAGYRYSPAELAMFSYLQSLGQDLVDWQPDVLASWFRKRSPFHTASYQVPAYVITSQCDLADLHRARDLLETAQYGETVALKTVADQEAAKQFERCRRSFEKEKPFQHHVIAPLRLLKSFIIHAGPVTPVPRFRTLLQRPWLLALKLFGVATYWVALIGGIAGLWYVARLRRWELWAIASPFLLVTVLFTFVFRRPEIRMLTLGFPALCFLSVLPIEVLWNRLRGWRVLRLSTTGLSGRSRVAGAADV